MLRRLSIRTKLAALMGTLIVTIALFVYLYFPDRLQNESEAAFEEKAATISSIVASDLAAPLYFGDMRTLREILASAKRYREVAYLCAIGDSGKILFTLQGDSLSIPGIPLPSISGQTRETRDFTAPIELGTKHMGMLHIGFSTAWLSSRVAASRETSAIASLIVIAVGLFMMWLISVWITRPLTHMVDTVVRIAGGDLTQRASIVNDDEIGNLARSFNAMIESLSFAYSQLEEANRTLERRVEDRTVEIVREIQERKRAEAALQRSERDYRGLFENAHDAIIIYNEASGEVLDVNRRASEVYAYSRSEMIGMPIGKLAPEPENKPSSSVPNMPNALLKYAEAVHYRRGGRRMIMEINTSMIEYRGMKAILSINRDITERKEREKEIRTYQERLQHLTAEMALAEERERRRIASELHDDLGQTLALLQMKLGKVLALQNQPEAESIVREMRTTVETTIQFVRSLAIQLSPPILYELGFISAAEWLAETFAERYGIPINFKVHRMPAVIPQAMEVLLFKSLTELLTNSVRHAQPKQIDVTVDGAHDEAILTVRDAGKGFDTEELGRRYKAEGGYGLFSINERLRQFGGSMTITSEVGKGTVTRISVPTAPGPSSQSVGRME